MHNRIDFNQLGGAPFDQQTLGFMQDSYMGIADCLSGFVGDNVIVTGCVVAGNSVSAGWIIVKGELLPFAKSETGVLDTFIIQETATPLVFESGESKNVEFKRIAMFGSNANAYKWSELARLQTFQTLSDTVDKHVLNVSNPHKVTKTQVGLSAIPNAISSDATSNSQSVLATTAMVHSVMKGKVITGKFPINRTSGYGYFKLSDDVIEIDKVMLISNLTRITPDVGGIYGALSEEYNKYKVFSSVETRNGAGVDGTYIRLESNIPSSAEGNFYCVFTLILL